MKSIIFSGDMGGDDLWALLILSNMVEAGQCDLLGIASCFGNTNVEQATRNVLDTLALTRISNTPVYQGSTGPISGLPPLLDGAYGTNGLSNATLPTSSLMPQTEAAHLWIEKALRDAETPIKIICTGPLTDIAKALDANPNLAHKGHEVIWLGGALKPTGLNHQKVLMGNGEYRQGNITQFAEFNAINDPVAAQIVADSGISLTIIPLDATQHLVADHGKITSFLRHMQGKEAIAIQLVSMLDDAAIMDSMKFKVHGGFQHDGQIPVWLTHPDLFLPAVPVTDLRFRNEHELAAGFNAMAMDFDFSKLGRHGQMTCHPSTGVSHPHHVVPGLYSFPNSPTVSNEEMQTMCDERWNVMARAIGLAL